MSDYEDYQLKVSWKLYWEVLQDVTVAMFHPKFYKDWWRDTKGFIEGCVVFFLRVLVTLTFPFSALLATFLQAKLNRQNKKALEELREHYGGNWYLD